MIDFSLSARSCLRVLRCGDYRSSADLFVSVNAFACAAQINTDIGTIGDLLTNSSSQPASADIAANRDAASQAEIMIYELRTYTLHAGKLPAYLDLAAKVGRPVRGNDYGINHGYWVAEFGALNQIWHLWSYDSLDARERLRGELAKNERWRTEYTPNVRPLLIRQDIRFLNPVIDIKPPEGAGHF